MQWKSWVHWRSSKSWNETCNKRICNFKSL